MPYALTPTLGGVIEPATPVTGAVYINDAGRGLLFAAAATFLTGGPQPTQRGDQVVVSAGANAGTYQVFQPISDTMLVVDLPWPAPGVAPAGETVTVTRQTWALTITDEATTSWATILANAPNVVRALRVGGGHHKTVYLSQLTTIRIVQTGATTTLWTSENEVVLPDNDQVEMADFNLGTGSAGGFTDLVIGRRGTDDRSPSRGSFWMGFAPSGEAGHSIAMHGSWVVKQPAVQRNMGISPEVNLSIVEGGWFFPQTAAGGGFWRGGIYINTSFGLASLATPELLEDLSLAFGTAAVLTFIGSSGSLVPISDFFLGDDYGTAGVAYTGVGSFVEFRDPKEDYPLSRLVSAAAIAGEYEKRYTWNPRFVERNEVGLAGSPLQGLTVEIFDINETTSVETPISGSPFMTDAGGRINTSGVVLLRERQTALGVGTGDLYSQRVRVSGPRTRYTNEITTASSPVFDVDVPVDLSNTDFEGEVSR